MRTLSPKTALILGFLLMVAGAALPFLMIIRVLEATLWLSFVAFIAQVLGLCMGTIGLAFYVRMKKE